MIPRFSSFDKVKHLGALTSSIRFIVRLYNKLLYDCSNKAHRRRRGMQSQPKMFSKSALNPDHTKALETTAQTNHRPQAQGSTDQGGHKLGYKVVRGHNQPGMYDFIGWQQHIQKLKPLILPGLDTRLAIPWDGKSPRYPNCFGAELAC
jgi:hypothetical protein